MSAYRNRPFISPYKRIFQTDTALDVMTRFLASSRHMEGVTLRQSRNPSDGTTGFVIEGPQVKRRGIDAFVNVHSNELE